jgi:hypothetical protein
MKQVLRYAIPVKTNCFELFAHAHKDNVNESQKPGVDRIPYECGLVYIGETGRNKTNCEKAEQDKSAVGKRTWTYDHGIKWDEATILAIDSHKFSRKMVN